EGSASLLLSAHQKYGGDALSYRFTLGRSTMDSLEQRYSRVRDAIHQACQDAGRDPKSVRLLAVSKTRSTDEVAALAALGQRDFGENYVQEAVAKVTRSEEHTSELQSRENLGCCLLLEKKK